MAVIEAAGAAEAALTAVAAVTVAAEAAAATKSTTVTAAEAACATTAAAEAATVTAAAKLATRRTTATAAKVTLWTAAALWETLHWLQARNHFRLELLVAVAFDVENLAAIAEFSKRNGQTIAACAAGTANAVGVVLSLHRQAVVENVGHGGHVNAACGHVSRHQNLHLAFAQCHQAAVAQALAQSAVQGDGAKAFLLQVSGQTVALHLGAGKDDGLVDGGVAQPVVEHLALVLCVVRPVQHLLDVGVLFVRGVNLNLLDRGATVTHHAHGQLLNARRKRGAEHHGLLALAGQLVDVGQVVREAQVEHTVGFVHHQELHLVELDLHRALQVKQTTGSSHHQVSVLQLGNLQLVRHTADHVGHAQATGVLDQVDSVVRHLLGQLAGGANNQRAGNGGLEVALVGRVFAFGALRRRFATGNSVGDRLFKLSAGFGFGFGLLANQRVQHGQ